MGFYGNIFQQISKGFKTILIKDKNGIEENSIVADKQEDSIVLKGNDYIAPNIENGEIQFKFNPSSFKTKQTKVNSPNTSGNATEFIDTLSQNENGEITVTKKKITANDLGLSNALHFIGAGNNRPATAQNGDIYLDTTTSKEYVWSNEKWVEFGDESAYALKTISITGIDGLTGGGDLTQSSTISLNEITKASLGKADNSKQLQTAYSKDGSTSKTITAVSQNENGNISVTYEDIAFPAPPTVNNGTFTVSGTGALTGSGSMTANQSNNTGVNLDIKESGITEDKLSDALKSKVNQAVTFTADEDGNITLSYPNN